MREKIEKDNEENSSMTDDKRNVEELLADEETTQDELQELKAWLFRENIRLATVTAELDKKQAKFEEEKQRFQEEMKVLNRKMTNEQQRIKKDHQLVAESWRSSRTVSKSWIWTAGGLRRSGQGLPPRRSSWRNTGSTTDCRK